jgi:hypothetical protein
MKVSPYHTTTPEDGAGHRNVYHDNNACSDGKRIKPEHKVSGTGGRPKVRRVQDPLITGR